MIFNLNPNSSDAAVIPSSALVNTALPTNGFTQIIYGSSSEAAAPTPIAAIPIPTASAIAVIFLILITNPPVFVFMLHTVFFNTSGSTHNFFLGKILSFYISPYFSASID